MSHDTKITFLHRAIGLVLLLILLTGGFELEAAEPFPEGLKDHPQILECHPIVTNDSGAVIRRSGASWLVTWGMATRWEPGEWIEFVSPATGRITVLPTPPDYICLFPE